MCNNMTMEIIPRNDTSRKDELVWPLSVEEYCDNSQVDARAQPYAQLDTNVEKYLYGSDNSCEGGDIFIPGDFC